MTPTKRDVKHEAKLLNTNIKLEAALLNAAAKVEIEALKLAFKEEAKALAEKMRATLPTQNETGILSHTHVCFSCDRTATCKEDCRLACDITRYHKCKENLEKHYRLTHPDPRPLGCTCETRPCLHRPLPGREATRIIVTAGGLQIGA